MGCDSVRAHSANRKRGSLLYVLSMERKCQEQGPECCSRNPHVQKGLALAAGAVEGAGVARKRTLGL